MAAGSIASSTLDLQDAVYAFDLAEWAISRGAWCVGHDEYLMTCPQCGKNKLSIHAGKKLWHCFVCENGSGAMRGGLVALLQLVENKTREQVAADLLTHATARPLPTRMPTLQDRTRAQLRWAPPINWPSLCYAITEATYAQIPYLQERQLSLAQVQAYALGVGTVGKMAQRLIFPCFEHGQLVYYQGRAMYTPENAPDGRFIKMLNPWSTPTSATKSEILFGFDTAVRHKRVAICEGPIDAIRAGPDAVATLGKQISPTQVAKLRAAGVEEVDFMWDGPGPSEPEGTWPLMLKAAPYLASFFVVRLVRLSHGDPGQRHPEELRAYRAQAQRWEATRGLVSK